MAGSARASLPSSPSAPRPRQLSAAGRSPAASSSDAPATTRAPATVLPPLPPPREAAPPTADALYRAAEAALAARNPTAADHALARLLAEHPSSPLADQALYERARIAYEQRAWASARGHLERLVAIPSTPLAEPGHYLACRIAVEARDGQAASCLADYRKTFPRSPHDLDALAMLVQLAYARNGCAAAAALVDELARTYPRAVLAAAWHQRCPGPR